MAQEHSSTNGHGNEVSTQGAHAEAHDVPQNQVFNHLLGELGDHYQFSWMELHGNLPIMFFDQGQFHHYGSEHEMLGEGQYVIGHGAQENKLDQGIYRASTVQSGHAKKVDFDFSITNLVVFEWIGMALVFILALYVTGKYKKNPKKAPSGFQNAWEAIVLYVRDEVIMPNISSKAAATRLTPYLLSLFFFILAANLIGLMPGGHATTGAIGVTMALAITAFVVVNYTAIKEAGIKHWAHHLLGGAPWWLFPIMLPIEIIGLFTRPFALMIRLFANMTAGHIVILSLVGLIFFFKTWAVAPVSVAFSLFIYTLELLVAFLQAYVFTILTAVFVGLAIGEGHHHDEHAEAH